MKKIIEETVSKEIDPYEVILDYLQEYDCWIYLSEDLVNRLKKLYPNHSEYRNVRPQSFVFWIRIDNRFGPGTNDITGLSMAIDKGTLWYTVSYVLGNLAEGEITPNVARDPEYIVFLS